MTTNIVLGKTNNLKEELEHQLTENPHTKRIDITCSGDHEDLSLSPLRGRELELLDLRDLSLFHDLEHVKTKKLVITIDHLMAGLVYVETSYLRWERSIPFEPDVIEIHLCVHLDTGRIVNFDTASEIPLYDDEKDRVLRLHEDLRNSKGVIIIVWDEWRDCDSYENVPKNMSVNIRSALTFTGTIDTTPRRHVSKDDSIESSSDTNLLFLVSVAIACPQKKWGFEC